MNLTEFVYKDKLVRTINLKDIPYFVAVDVCDILELLDTSSALSRLDDDEKVILKDKTRLQELEAGAYVSQLALVNESGLYNLILRSDKPEAKPFRKWITSEVLPSIRKDGGYILPTATENQLDRLQETITTLLVNQQKQLDNLAIEQKKLFKSGETNPGCYSVVVAGMYDEYEDEGYVTVDEWLRAKGVTLDTTQLNTIRKRAASFLRIGKSVEPTKIGNRIVYSPSQYCYLEQALVSTLGLTV